MIFGPQFILIVSIKQLSFLISKSTLFMFGIECRMLYRVLYFWHREGAWSYSCVPNPNTTLTRRIKCHCIIANENFFNIIFIYEVFFPINDLTSSWTFFITLEFFIRNMMAQTTVAALVLTPAIKTFYNKRSDMRILFIIL